jgi:hypothetical protein
MDVLDEHITSIIRVERSSEVGTTLVVTVADTANTANVVPNLLIL